MMASLTKVGSKYISQINHFGKPLYHVAKKQDCVPNKCGYLSRPNFTSSWCFCQRVFFYFKEVYPLVQILVVYQDSFLKRMPRPWSKFLQTFLLSRYIYTYTFITGSSYNPFTYECANFGYIVSPVGQSGEHKRLKRKRFNGSNRLKFAESVIQCRKPRE